MVRRVRDPGFSLIELLVALSVLAVLSTLAVPAIQLFVSRSTMRGISADFTLALQRARTEAIHRNQCVAICMSDSTHLSTPKCTDSGANWGTGWIVFSFPSCATVDTGSPNASTDVVLAHEGLPPRYQLSNPASVHAIVFNARGLTQGVSTRFDLQDTRAPPGEASINRTFCVDRAGRVLVTAFGATCY
jgi:type IV fimbrial biogenesis protein FimT